jgi:hypothetical protein
MRCLGERKNPTEAHLFVEYLSLALASVPDKKTSCRQKTNSSFPNASSNVVISSADAASYAKRTRTCEKRKDRSKKRYLRREGPRSRIRDPLPSRKTKQAGKKKGQPLPFPLRSMYPPRPYVPVPIPNPNARDDEENTRKSEKRETHHDHPSPLPPSSPSSTHSLPMRSTSICTC